MRTIAIDDQLSCAKEISELMCEIDPKGVHEAFDDQVMAISSVSGDKPDIAFLDIEMSGLSGLEMAAGIKKISPDTNIVFITAYSQYALEAMGLHPSGYLIKPATKEQLIDEIDNLRHPLNRNEDKKLLRVQCFGNFEVFADGKIVRFSRSLSKEALAYLIDRRGAGCTVNEICSVLWEDEQIDTNRKSQCRMVLGALRKDLDAVGAGDVVVKMWNTWGVDTDKVSCDFYDFLHSDRNAVNNYRGEYMAQYSWAEMTNVSLYDVQESLLKYNAADI